MHPFQLANNIELCRWHKTPICGPRTGVPRKNFPKKPSQTQTIFPGPPSALGHQRSQHLVGSPRVKQNWKFCVVECPKQHPPSNTMTPAPPNNTMLIVDMFFGCSDFAVLESLLDSLSPPWPPICHSFRVRFRVQDFVYAFVGSPLRPGIPMCH
jgi:hypothetical protein